MAFPVPVIDLAAACGPHAPARVLDLVRCATETAGVVQVVNHGVPLELLTEFDRRIGELRGLPRDQQAGVARPAGRQAQPAARPADDPVLRDLAFRCLAAGQSLAERVLGLYARARGLPQGTFPVDPLPYLNLSVDDAPAWRYTDTGYTADRLLPGQAGGCVLTVRAQAGAGRGLLVQGPAGDWAPVPPVAGALQVFSGPLLARWTNGRLRPARHRIVPVGAAAPRSAAVFRYRALGWVPGPLGPFAGPREEPRREPAVRWDLPEGDAENYLRGLGRPAPAVAG